MDINTTFKIKFQNGKATIRFPDAMKRMTNTTLQCCSLYVQGDRKFNNICLFIVCDSSYFRDENFEKKLNILAEFPVRATSKFYPGRHPTLPLTSLPETLNLKIVNFDDEIQDLSAYATFEVKGKCRDRLLLI